MNIEQTAATSPASPSTKRPRIFIVHGHHEALLSEVSDCLVRLGAEPVVLRDQAAGGRTIIENLERHASDVAFAVVLMTGDDWGRVGARRIKGKLIKWHARTAPRARQNVVFEAGLFVGKLGRRHVCFLRDPSLEQPSDLQGVIYISLSEGWQDRLVQEVLSSGVLGSRTS